MCRFSHIIRLNSQELFKAQGDKRVIRQSVSLYNQDPNASLPDGVTSIEVAALMKCYTASLPEPLTTFELYNDIRNARSSIHVMRNILKQMDTRSLAMELAHIIMWQKRPEERYEQFWNQPSKPDFQANTDAASNYTALDMLVEDNESLDPSSSIPGPLMTGFRWTCV